MHTAIEKSVEEAVQEYYDSYFIATDRHVEEVMKLEILAPKAKAMIPEGEHEVKIETPDFIGFVDLVSENEDGTYSIYDFKYSNSVDIYKKSAQLHLYKYFWEQNNPGKTVSKLYYLFVPKTSIRQKNSETLHEFRQRLQNMLKSMQPKMIEIEYDSNKVIEFLIDAKHVIEATEYPLNSNDFLWSYSEYYDYITKGADYMILPESTRRDISAPKRKIVWLYGQPFTGKTTFANKFNKPLMLNTDGNIEFVDAPYIPIKDKVEVEGRRTKRTLAWDVLKEVIEELEKKENDFETIILDLTEDTYEFARYFIYEREGIDHESDDSFRAWDMVTTEFLNVMRKLSNLDYENIIIISHEDSSRDITKKSGENITAIKPNIREKVATKLAGMVDIVGRVVAEPDGKRVLSFKSDEVIFGGGRLPVQVDEIPLDVDEFNAVYEEVSLIQTGAVKEEPSKRKSKSKRRKEEPEEVEEVEELEELTEEDLDDMGVKELKELLDDEGIEYSARARKSKLYDLAYEHLFGTDEEVEEVEDDSDEVENDNEVIDDEEIEEDEEPRTRRRRRRTAEETEEEVEVEVEEEEEEVEEEPTRRRRRRRRD